MYKYVTVITSAAIIFFFYPEVEAVSRKCGGEDVDMSEQMITNIKECLQMVGAETVHDLGLENGACFFKCTLEKRGLIDENGLHREKIDKIVDSGLPEAVQGDMKNELGKCIEEEGKEIKFKDDDDMCSSFLPMAMCVHFAFVKMCGQM